jgi:hypothetical protein
MGLQLQHVLKNHNTPTDHGIFLQPRSLSLFHRKPFIFIPKSCWKHL